MSSQEDVVNKIMERMVNRDNHMDNALENITISIKTIMEKLTATEVGSAVSSGIRNVEKVSSKQPATQSPENPKYEEADFRHRLDAETDANRGNTSSETTLPRTSYFRSCLSSESYMDIPSNDSTIVRSITNIDPVKSGISLTYLDMPHIYKWSQDFVQLQKRHPHEQLSWVLFISKSMTFRINASNESKRLIRKTIISGTQINLEMRNFLASSYK
jgi:hypothetical protein